MKQLSDFELGKIVALSEQGFSIRAIAQKMEKSSSTIQGAL
jgi:IS30 family transposase